MYVNDEELISFVIVLFLFFEGGGVLSNLEWLEWSRTFPIQR